MSKNIVILIIGAVASLVFLQNCNSREADPRLVRAEAMMGEAPDSSLYILQGIASESLHSSSDRAFYGMLYTQAQDKNYVPLTDDSLISASVDYYNSTDNYLHQVISTYYQGRVYYQQENYPLAIVSFFKARDIAKSHGLDFWTSMACRGIADIYDDTYNSADQVTFAQEEYEYMKKCGTQPYLDYALHDLARALSNHDKPERSLQIARQLKDSASLHNDPYLNYCAMVTQANILFWESKSNEALPAALEAFASENATANDSIKLSHILLSTGDIKAADDLMNQISGGDGKMKILYKFRLAVKLHKYEEALQISHSLDSISDKYFRNSMSLNLNSAVSNHYVVKSKLDEAEIKASKTMTWVIILVAIIIVGLIVTVSIILTMRKNRKINEKVLLAEQLQESLEKSNDENSKSAGIIENLMSGNYELLQELSDIIISNSDSRKARKKVADTVTRVIEEFSIHGGKIEKLESQVDMMYDNVYSDFKKDLPNLKEADYLLFLFSILGFSNATIFLFLKEEKIEGVYNRKRRLKDKIKRLDEEKQERYMHFF